MKLPDLRPAAGSRRPRARVGRGIAAGQGKTAGRGTKGQKARAGSSIPAWFEGGQTPIHIRVPKLRGFKNRFRVEYAVVNVGQISAYAEAGRFGVETRKPSDPVTVNAESLASAGLIGGDDRPVKVLGQGEVSQKLFVAADAFSASARRKIEEAGGFVQVLGPDKVEADRRPEADEASPAAKPEGEAESPAAEAEAPARPEESTDAEPTAESEQAPKPARRRSTKSADES